jgi:hypothetical protein
MNFFNQFAMGAFNRAAALRPAQPIAPPPAPVPPPVQPQPIAPPPAPVFQPRMRRRPRMAAPSMFDRLGGGLYG